ncbi:MAG: FkbM family methyltransferase [Gammaproteobacteria bacterium]|nr:FkbM family methyltransferase [Gammaproteobacteria bacterium]
MKQSSRMYLPEDDSYRIAVEQYGQLDPVIIDGGAHRGGSVEAFSHFVPHAEFHCFEPDPLLADELTGIFKKKTNVHVVRVALGESKGKAMFNINASRATSSLLPSIDTLQPDLQTLCQLVEQVEVDVATIDDYCAAQNLNRVDIIKLDLQGSDYKALRGAKSTLRRARVVLIEVSFVQIYKNSELFPAVLRLMEECEFTLFTLCGLHYGENDELLWANAIFVNSGSHKNDLLPAQSKH